MITYSSLQPELDCGLLCFHGELDAAAAPDLRARFEELAAAPPAALLIDLGACSFIDSLGIAAVVDGARSMQAQAIPAVIACHSPQARRILELGGVDGLIQLFWSRDEAIEALAEARA
jgi:anti-anti-sigma factor